MIEPNEDILRDWLLGRLPVAEAEALEQRLLEDDDLGHALRAAENDLLDDLARERLHGAARVRAEAYFKATPSDRTRLRIARALAAVAGAPATEHASHGHVRPATTRAAHGRRAHRSAFVTRLFAAACAVLVAGIGVRVWLMQRATDDPSEAPFTITLTGGEQRGSGAVDVVIPRNVAQIRVQAEVDAAEGAACTLSVDEGDAAAFSASHLVARSAGPYRFIEATVPANVLANGQHRLRVVAEQAPGSSSSWLLTTRSP